jgi:uncharacterized protein
MSTLPRTPSPAFCACCGRRDFLVTSFSAAAALLLTRTFGRAADALPALAGATVNPITNAIPFAAPPLPLSAVRLTGGPLKKAQELGRANLLKLDMDRIMYRFRERAGLPPKADDGYGSWEGPGRQLTGAIAGHYLSAVSYMYAATGDSQFKDRAAYLVNEYKEVQDKQGDGYLGALMGNPPRGTQGGPLDGKILFEQIAQGNINAAGRPITNPAQGGFDLNGMWSPWYVQHKLLSGLRDAYRQTGNRAALDIAAKHAAWIETIVGGLSPEQLQLMLTVEFGGINESLADLYADTGDDRWLKLSQRFHHDAIVNPLAQGQDILAGKHGNTNIPKLLGELARYVYAGNAPDGDAAKFFWEAVVNHHSFATGGHGYDESFGPADKLSGQVDGTIKANGDTRTCESCNVYNMVKLTRLLFALNPDNKFAEFHERALFNHVLASINFDDGQLCYMVPVGRGVTHEYQGDGMTCCVGTGLENHALHGYGIYNTSADKLWVNLYAPSTAQWKEAGIGIETSVVPGDTDVATVKFTAGAPKAFSLALRRPFWAGDGFALKVNGQPEKDLPNAGTYAELKRTWKTGDTVEVTLPKALYKETLPDNPRRTALKWGPYVLGADYGAPNVRNVQQAAQAAATAANSVGGVAGGAGVAAASGGASGGRRGGRGRGGPQPKYAVFLAAADAPVTTWLKRLPANDPAQPDATTNVPTVFHATGVGGDNNEVDFKPFYQLTGRRYGIYQDIYTPEDWQTLNPPPAPTTPPPAAATPA